MNAINIQYCEIDNKIVISKRVFVKFIYMIVYVCIYAINYKRINEFFNKKEEKVEDDEEEEDKKDWDVWTKETRYLEKDVNKWYIILGSELARYKGEWADGVANGKGVKEFLGSTGNSHSIIECNFVNGSANGYGIQTFDITADHERFSPYYEGEFKNGKQHGKGTYHYGNGCYRKGNLVKGNFEGKGIYYDSYKNRTWVGNYVDDVRDLDNGVWYDGEIKMEEVENECEIIYDFEGTGEQLRRLRANNPKNDVETHDEYESRIWNMAYKEDAEEEREKLLSKAKGENAPVANFRDALKGLKQEWHAKWERDKAVNGKI